MHPWSPKSLAHSLLSVHIQFDTLQYVQWNSLSRVCVQVDHTVRPCPHASIFFWKCESFFLAVFKIYPFTRSVFDTVTSSFSKSSVLKSLHENTKTRKQCFQREIIASKKFHCCMTLRYFDQSCLSLVTISNSLHSFTDGSSSKVVTEWRKCQDPQSRD